VSEVATITLPLPPNEANARRGHWGIRSRAKKRYLEDAAFRILVAGIEPFDRKVRVDAHFIVGAMYDPIENLPMLLKWPMDALVSAGILQNDTAKWVEPGRLTQAVERVSKRKAETLGEFEARKRKVRRQVTITLTPVQTK